MLVRFCVSGTYLTEIAGLEDNLSAYYTTSDLKSISCGLIASPLALRGMISTFRQLQTYYGQHKGMSNYL
jgi:hypothetical protein